MLERLAEARKQVERQARQIHADGEALRNQAKQLHDVIAERDAARASEANLRSQLETAQFEVAAHQVGDGYQAGYRHGRLAGIKLANGSAVCDEIDGRDKL